MANSVEIEDLKQQFNALRADMKVMTELVKTGVAERSENARDMAAHELSRVTTEAQMRAREMRHDAEGAIIRNPFTAVAVCAGIGFLLGVLTRR